MGEIVIFTIIYQSSKVLGPSNPFPNLQGLGAQKKVYTVNLDPAVRNLAYPVTLRQLPVAYDRHVKLGKMIRHVPGKSCSLRCKISRETVI